MTSTPSTPTSAARVFQNYIGGQWQHARSGQTFPNDNPATGEILGYFPLSGAMATRACPKRSEILYRTGELLTRYKEVLARTMTQEIGKVLKEARGDEL